MKILTVNVNGIPGGSPSDLIEANVFQDYDAVVLDPEGLDGLYRSVKDALWLDRGAGRLKTEAGIGLANRNATRRQQVEGLLQKGGVVVCFLRAVRQYVFYPEQSVSSLRLIREPDERVGNYDWIFGGAVKRLDINYGTGQTIDQMDASHPFYEYFKTKPSWEAYVDIGSCPGWKVLASAYGTHAVALSRKMGHGHIVLLPSSYDYRNGQLVERCIKEMLGEQEPSQMPGWVASLVVPGQPETISKILSIEAKVQKLEQDRSALVDNNEELEQWKWLLYETGKQRLELVVRRALTLLGCSVEEQPEKDSDGLVRCEFGTALLEIEGAVETVKIGKASQLIRNIGNFLAATGECPKGILVGNPFRLDPLDNRPPKGSQKQLFSKESLEAAEKQNIAVLLSVELYDVVGRILSGKLSEEDKKQVRELVFGGKGLVRLVK